jgi:hypothetical protein
MPEVRRPDRALMSRHAWIAALDTLLLVLYLALQEPGGATGFVWHEWFGIASIPLIGLHVALSWSWISANWPRAREGRTPHARINYVLNTCLFVMMMIVILTGLVISEYALPAFGVPSHSTRRWEQFHNFTSALMIPVAALHLALNWSWIRRAVRRYLSPRARWEQRATEEPPQ